MSGDHLDASCWDEPGYVESKLAVLEKYNLKVWAISNHLKGQAVCDDPIDFRHEAIVSSKAWGDGTPRATAGAACWLLGLSPLSNVPPGKAAGKTSPEVPGIDRA